MEINQTILGTNGEIPLKLLSTEVTKAHKTVHWAASFLSLSPLPRPMNSNNDPSKPMLPHPNQRKPVYRPLRMREPGALVNRPLTSLIQKSDPPKPILLNMNQRKPVYRPLRMREPGALVNQPPTSLIQKSETKSRKQLQRHLRPIYHHMLANLIKKPIATNSTSVPFPNMPTLKKALRYYSTPSSRTSLGIQTRMPLMDKCWSA